MKNKRFYFVIFKENDIVFGLNIGLYPNLSLWLRLPFVEIRMGVVLKK
jgi:hypothetical protein